MQYNKRCKKALVSEYGTRHFERNYNAMVVEGLDTREKQAAELAYRDFKIERLERKIVELNGPLILEAILHEMPQCLEE